MPEQLRPELPLSREELLHRSVNGFLDLERQKRFRNMCNLLGDTITPEAKGVAYVVLAAEQHESGDEVSSGQLRNALRDRCEDKAIWRPTYPKQYFTSSFSPGMLVTRVKARRASLDDDKKRLRAFFSLTEAGEAALGPIGLILGWSLEHRELSTQQVFGVASASGRIRRPEVRANLLLELLTHPGDLTSTTVRGFTKLTKGVYTDCTRGGNRDDWITVESSLTGQGLEYRVRSVEPLTSLSAITPLRALFNQFLATQKVGQIFTRKQVGDYIILQHATQADNVDDLSFKKRFHTLLAYSKEIERVKKYAPGVRAKLSITPGYEAALTKLGGLLIGILDNDETLLASGRKRAFEIANNPQEVTELLNKSAENSLNAMDDPAAMRETIRQIVVTSDGVSAEDIIAVLRRQGCHVPSREGMKEYLNALATEGAVGSSLEQSSEFRKKRMWRFYPPK